MKLKEKLKEKLINNVADWWFDIFIGPQDKDSGARGDMPSLMAEGLATTIANRHRVNENQRQPFRDALRKSMEAWLDRYTATKWIGLCCDYGPGEPLASAMREAGIHESRAPWKTNMYIRSNGVTVSAGYGSPPEFLWLMNGEEPLTRKVIQYRSIVPEWRNDEGIIHERWENVQKHLCYDEETYAKHMDRINSSNDETYYEVYEDDWTEVLKDGEWVREEN